MTANITEEQRANLTKLAAYLRTLPVDYPDFAMQNYTSDGTRLAHVAECGTAACAAGHGPAAGIRPLKREYWLDYSRRAFVPSGEEWAWCFSSIWSDVDNTVHGAAARIEWLLTNGLPRDSDEQRWGEAPLCYLPSSVASA